VTHTIIIAFIIVVLTVLSIYGVILALRLVPDETKFDFMQFRRISFPISAVLTIVAITLYFTHGLNFGIDFKGGTLLEIQTKSGPANIAQLRTQLDGLNLGDIQLQQFGGPPRF
jgi:preprotein translocase subunit SecF